VAGPARAPRGRARGRHLLGGSALAADIVARAGVAPDDLVVDLGAGTGVLTRELERRAGAVWAVELDPVHAAALRRRFARTSVHVVEADARRVRWPEEPFKVVANLPFAGAAEILRALLDRPGTPLETADVILQWEAACKRAALWPSTLLGVYWGAWYDLRVTRRVAASAFSPAPPVNAGVLRVKRRQQPLVPRTDATAYRQFLRQGFGVASIPLRRALAGRLSALELKRAARELGFAPGARARDLDAHMWASLFRLAAGNVRRDG
jgi:23S rRNA (adenine-N6)-dimethyltransferase